MYKKTQEACSRAKVGSRVMQSDRPEKSLGVVHRSVRVYAWARVRSQTPFNFLCGRAHFMHAVCNVALVLHAVSFLLGPLAGVGALVLPVWLC